MTIRLAVPGAALVAALVACSHSPPPEGAPPAQAWLVAASASLLSAPAVGAPGLAVIDPRTPGVGLQVLEPGEVTIRSASVFARGAPGWRGDDLLAYVKDDGAGSLAVYTASLRRADGPPAPVRCSAWSGAPSDLCATWPAPDHLRPERGALILREPGPDGSCLGADNLHWLVPLDALPDAAPTALPPFQYFQGGVDLADGSLAGLLFSDAGGCFVLAASGDPASRVDVGGGSPCYAIDWRPGGAWISAGGSLLRLDAATLTVAAPGGVPTAIDSLTRAGDDTYLYFLHADAAGLAAWRARYDGRAAAERVGEVPGAFTLSVTATALVAGVRGDAATPPVLLTLPKAGGTATELYRSPVAAATLLAVEANPGSDQVFLTDSGDGTAVTVRADGQGLARFGDRSLPSAFACDIPDMWRPAGRRCLLAEASNGVLALRSIDAADGQEVARLGEVPAGYPDGLRMFGAAGTLALVQVYSMAPRGFGLLLVDTEQAGSAALVSEGLIPLWSPW